MGVSIHAPTWGATGYNLRVFLGIEFQSTLPHGERLYDVQQRLVSRLVSIHAPTWGATHLAELEKMECVVSIHAPTWGAT